MTPEAHVAAAIEVLDAVIGGDSAERVLTTWGRQHRFAGSGDRAAIRDHVFDALRRLRSSAARGGAMTGRGVMIGLLRDRGTDPETLFTGEGHAPAPLDAAERRLPPEPDPLDALDCPAWLAPALSTSLGADFAPVMEALRHRAPVFLRANLARTTPGAAADRLAGEGIETRPHPLAATALEVLTHPRRVASSAAFREGLVELQDAASQAVADAVPLVRGSRLLDYCAGGGGKTLAMAARTPARYFAHDADAGRMADLPGRAKRANVRVDLLQTGDLAGQPPFDTVFVDAPCSGSGSWRRAPQGKWRLDAAGLDRLTALQDGILDSAAALVAANGHLVYATCSLLDAENRDRVAAFLGRAPGWSCLTERRLTPLDGGDGFYVAVLNRQ
ncbi:RsmB/NOP family class I SAM-dependent RNA methyltransferase [Oceaniglobus roseus]|uniref:RsmB/NOP family class I SAM-dependent RNA methyltransferase n=1 Tax=Oceaniglobus roseus TaxID=1737570 RepID=UPI000C7F1585|nr:RsmB/NOP family class I SAM-dependent RNA methyltransferase [Kandeliimicrobium roseum]